jgi:hypothetical protein
MVNGYGTGTNWPDILQIKSGIQQIKSVTVPVTGQISCI